MSLIPQTAPAARAPPPMPPATRVLPGVAVKAKVPVPRPSKPPGWARVGQAQKVTHHTLL